MSSKYIEGTPTKDKKVILAKQFRPGPGKVFNELPSGGIEKKESLEEAIQRELLEETGYIGKIEYVGKSYADGYSNMIHHCFVAIDCEKVAEQKLDEGEFVEVVLLSLKEFRELLRSGDMTDIQSGYMGLDFLGLL
jgi:ADP-ribose pyrophosphatase